MSTPRMTIAVQGEPGSNSALAAEQYVGNDRLALLPCASFTDLFAAVTHGDAALGVAPVENSLGGSVHPVWDLLTRFDCIVIDEMYVYVRHCLIAHPSVPLHEIRWVYSHEQALAQCRRYLGQLVWLETDHIIPVYDTAGAVKMIKARGRRSEAAIASPLAADIHAMNILATDIQTDSNNYTRFLVFRSSNAPVTVVATASDRRCLPDAPAASGLCKYTLILVLADCGRRLPEIMAVLDRNNYRIVKLETAKIIGHPWQYRVYLEFETLQHNATDAMLETRLPELAGTTRVLGPYPAASRPDACGHQ